MVSYRTRNNIRYLLLVLCFLVATTVLAMMFYFVWSEQSTILDKAYRRAEFVAEMVAKQTEKSFEKVFESLEGINKLIELKPAQAHEIFFEYKQRLPELAELFLIDTDGNVVSSSSDRSFPNVLNHDYIQIHLHGSYIPYFISGPAVSDFDPDIHFIALSRRTGTADNPLSNILVAYIDIEKLYEHLFTFELPGFNEILLLSANGKLAVGYPAKMVEALSKEDQGKALWNEGEPKGLLEITLPSTSNVMMTAYKKIPHLNLLAVAGIEKEALLGTWFRKFDYVLLVAVSWIGLVLFLTILLFKTQKELAQLAMLDPLTKLPNRLYFSEASGMLLAKAKRDKSPLSMVMLDIDYFKKINDTFGHSEGDNVICALAAMMRKICRKSDLLARVGGEEFCILMPDTDSTGAKTVAERLRKNVAEQVFCHSDTDFQVTISLGIAEYGSVSSNMQVLFADSDVAMYYSKHHGRNQTSIYSPGLKKSAIEIQTEA